MSLRATFNAAYIPKPDVRSCKVCGAPCPTAVDTYCGGPCWRADNRLDDEDYERDDD